MKGSFIRSGVITTRQSGSQPKQVSHLFLYHIAKGRTRWSVDSRSWLLREGDFFLVLPGQTFSGVESSESALLQVEWLEISVGSQAKVLREDALAESLRCHREDAEEIVRKLLSLPRPIIRPADFLTRCLRFLLATEEGKTGLLRRTTATTLLAGICSTGAEQGTSTPEARSSTETDVALFLSELESRCEEDWTLDSMASGAGLKRSRFGTLCRKLTGESPAVYLNRLRIRRSRKFLRDTERSVTEIAFDCGFSSSQYFAKTFRRFQGHEPTHYRRLAKDRSLGRSVQYLKGDSARNVAYAKQEVGKGDFAIAGEIMLDRLGDTAASLEFGADRFGFDGREGCFFLEGGTFGEAQFFHRSADIIREGDFFPFLLSRKGNSLSMKVNGSSIFSLRDDSGRPIGRIGLRPLRNGIRVKSFAINEAPVKLEVPRS